MLQWLSALPIVGKMYKDTTDIIDQVVTDKDEAIRLKTELAAKVSGYEHDQEMARIAERRETNKEQAEINKIEAKHTSIFIAGWRPGLGWLCIISIGFNVLVYPFMIWFFLIMKGLGWIPETIPDPPAVDATVLIPVVVTMLGVGVMRSYDKKNGTDTRIITNKNGGK